MKIYHLRHNEIDKSKWNVTIDTSQYGLPYAYSWYLDVVSPQWEALVSEEYSYIMPLPIKQKIGVKYLVQPPWLQQLGVISINENITPKIEAQFIKKIPYIYYCFNLNHTNGVEYKNMRVNMTIDLGDGVEDIRRGYNSNTKRNIRKAQQCNLNISDISDIELYNIWKIENRGGYAVLERLLLPLIQKSLENGVGRCYGVWQEGQLVAALFAIKTKNRFVYLAPVSTAKGKRQKAMFLLIDTLIEQMAGSEIIFDFEGSLIPGVAQFYRGFGSKTEPYANISRMHNRHLMGYIYKLYLRFKN